jgi:hypothetical protein
MSFSLIKKHFIAVADRVFEVSANAEEEMILWQESVKYVVKSPCSGTT